MNSSPNTLRRLIGHCAARTLCIVALGLGLCAQAAEMPSDTMATVVSLQGVLDIRIDDGPVSTFTRIADIPGQAIRSNWTIATEKNSRCRLMLGDRSIVTLGPGTTVSFGSKGKGFITRLTRGVMSFFHRGKGGEMEVHGPEVSAVIFGTEFTFAVASNGVSTVTLFDGRVQFNNGLALTNGEVATASLGNPPRKTAVLTSSYTDAIQWFLYYPAILDPADFNWDAPDADTNAVAKSIALYQSGDLLEALAAYPTNRAPASWREKLFQSALLLSVGNVPEAQALLDDIPSSSDSESAATPAGHLAEALRSMIATVEGRSDPRHDVLGATHWPASRWMAHSYRMQSIGKLEIARNDARIAVTQSPNFGFGWARLAELEFGFGQRKSALKALAKAMVLTPRNAQAHALNGFLLCAENHFDEARSAFEMALFMDGALGNAWLGRGLCRIREGDFAGGRRDIEIAAASEPLRALLRSYLGKAFFEERQFEQALRELQLAMTLDPDDPTSWLYSALLKQNLNRGNEAIADLEQSKKLNANRQIYRSQLLLDQDQAVRSANLAGMYQDAGLQETAVNEASRAVNSDYANASAHAFLANAYDGMRDPGLVNLRYETPWNSELLLANLLAPPGVGVLSQNISQQEYSRMFDANHAGLISSTEYRSQGDWIHSSSQYGRYDNMSYSVGVDYRDENGQRPNQERQLTYLTASAKMQITPSDSLLLMASTLDSQAGDLGQYYDPAMARPRLQVKETQEPSVFLGYHREFTPQSHTLLLIGRVEDSLQLSDPDAAAKLVFRDARGVISNVVPYPNDSDTNSFNLNYRREKTIWSSELQQLWLSGSHSIIAGMRYQQSAQDVRSSLEITDTPRFKNDIPYAQSETTGFYRISPYLYEQWQWNSLRAFAGVSYDRLHYPENIDLPPITSRELTQDQFSPKAGLEWSIEANTTARLAWTRSLGGQYDDQSYRLEPSQVAGITQSYRSMIPESYSGNAAGLIPGARFETWGAGLDHRFPTRTYLTLHAEHLREDGDREIGAFKYSRPYVTNFDSLNQQIQYRESSMVVALNQLVGRDWSFGLRYQVSQAELECQFSSISTAVQKKALADQNLPLNEQDRALLHEVRLDAIWNNPSGFFWRGGAHWHAQDNAQDMAWMKNDNFWQLDTYLGYRFLQRRASLQAGLLNILDQDYRLNPFNLMRELPRRRTLTVQVKIAI